MERATPQLSGFFGSGLVIFLELRSSIFDRFNLDYTFFGMPGIWVDRVSMNAWRAHLSPSDYWLIGL